MFSEDFADRYLIVSHAQTCRPYRIVGTAYGRERSGSYVMYLKLFPRVPYFIVRNRFRPEVYTIFSGRDRLKNGDYHYFGRIGSAVDVISTGSIEIYLPDLRQIYYLRPDPLGASRPVPLMAS